MYGTRSDYEIKYDYQRAKNQSDKLYEVARELRRLMNDDYENILSELSGKWHGESANAFIGKSEMVKGNVIETAAEIERTAEKIMATAERLYNAEMRAKEIAEKRSY